MDTENAPNRRRRHSAGARRASPQKSSNTLGDYRLLEKKLGEGAMGVVYKPASSVCRAKWPQGGCSKHIANKTQIAPALLPSRVAGSLGHPNMCRVTGWTRRWLHYFAMEFVDGESLQQVLHRLGRLSVATLAHPVLLRRGLAARPRHEVVLPRHQAGQHYDHAPGGVKIADFGHGQMARRGQALTQNRPRGRHAVVIRGAGRNIQGRGEPLRHLTPWGALALLHVDRPAAVHRQDAGRRDPGERTGTFPPARQFNNEVPEKLDLILLKMCAKQVKYRYAAARK